MSISLHFGSPAVAKRGVGPWHIVVAFSEAPFRIPAEIPQIPSLTKSAFGHIKAWYDEESVLFTLWHYFAAA